MDDDVFNLIKKLEEDGNYEEAIHHLQTIHDEKLGSFDIRNDMGRNYNKMGRYEDALSNFDIVLSMDDSNTEYLFGKGISCIGLNRFDEALKVFKNIINLDSEDANAWYYKSLISKSLGDFNADKYFREFLRLDNDEFRYARSFYRFGILFDEIEHRYRGFYRLDVLSEFKNELKSLELDDNQFTEIIRLVPLEDLFNRIPVLKNSKFGTDTEGIIRREFKKQGLTDEDVDDLFKIDSVENLKKEVIELCGEDPFPAAEGYSEFVPLKTASRYNVLKPKLLKKNPDLLLFNKGNFYLDYGEIESAIECYDEGLKYNPDNLMLKFVKCCANYKLGDNNV